LVCDKAFNLNVAAHAAMKTFAAGTFQVEMVCSGTRPYQQITRPVLAPLDVRNPCWHICKSDLGYPLPTTGQRDGQSHTEMACKIQKNLGVRVTTPCWCIMRECGLEPLQFNWFWATLRFYNSLPRCNSTTMKKILHA